MLLVAANDKAGFLRWSSWACTSSHLPRTLFWQHLNHLFSFLPKLLKYARSWSNGGAFGACGRQSFPPVGCRRSDMKTGREQRLVGTVKGERTTAAHQNPFSQTGMKYPTDCRKRSNMSKALLSLRRYEEPGRNLRDADSYSTFSPTILLSSIRPVVNYWSKMFWNDLMQFSQTRYLLSTRISFNDQYFIFIVCAELWAGFLLVQWKISIFRLHQPTNLFI